MKEKIKRLLVTLAYQLYKIHIFHNKLHVYSIEETIDILVNSEKSLIRYGDGEIKIIEGRSVEFQDYDKVLADRLCEILGFKEDNLLIAIPDIFDSLDLYTHKSADFWKEHLFFSRNTYERYCNVNKKYYNAFISRMYYNYKDKSQCAKWYADIRRIWDEKKIVVVEGTVSHNGVGNDLFDNAKKVERIVCPSKNAFFSYRKILDACLEIPKETLILVAVGITAKVLVQDLFSNGYRVIDIGNLDMEYEWFLHQTEQKVQVQKHKVVGIEENQRAGYQEYLEQVRVWIE